MIALTYSVGDGTVRNNRMSPVGVQIEIGAIHVHARQYSNTASPALNCVGFECGEWVYIVSYYVIRILALK